MGMFSEFLARARYVIGPVTGICVVVYFAYHAINGDRGLLAMLQLDRRVTEARAVLAESTARRQVFEHRVKLLRGDNIDPDMLEERARMMLNYGFDEDIVILEKPPAGPCFPKPSLL